MTGSSVSKSHTPVELRITAGKLKKIKKEGSLECCLVMHSSVIQDVADGQPYNPYILLAVDGDNGFVYQPVIVGDFYAQPDKVVNELLAVLLEMKCHPKVIRVCDERTCSLLSPACELLGTKLEVVEDLPCLEPVMIGLFL